jgi:hypothetical protein
MDNAFLLSAALIFVAELGFSDVIDAGAYVDLAAAGAPTAP